MASANTLPRLLFVHTAIKSGKTITAQDISSRFGGSHRSALRTIEYMKDQLRAPVRWEPRRKTYIYTDPSYELPTIPLTHGEAIALLLVYQGILEQLPLPLAQDLSSAVAKLQDFLPQTMSVNLADLFARLSFAIDPARRIEVQFLDDVRGALEQKRTLHMTYYTASRDQVLERDLDPYHLTYRRGDWYVVGYCHLRKNVQTFALSRIRKMRLVDETFEIPPTFDVAHYFEYAFGVDNAGPPTRVVVEFEVPEARYIGERTWHPSQKLKVLKDGTLRLELEVSLNYELRQWLLSYGSRVRIVEPPELVREMAAEYERAAARARTIEK